MSFINPFKAVFPRLDKVFQQDTFFEKAKHLFPIYRENGFYEKVGKEGLYIIQIKTSERKYIGVITATPIEYYLNGRVIKHEKTLRQKELKQVVLSKERKGFIKPILLTYPKVDEITKMLETYIDEHSSWYSIPYRRTITTFWKVTNKHFIKNIKKKFDKSVKATYIADGHHRAATTARLYEEWKNEQKKQDDNAPNNYLFTALFDSEEINIKDFSRVVTDLGGNTSLEFMAKITTKFIVEKQSKPYQPDSKNTIGLCLDGQWFKLEWRKQILKKYANKGLKEAAKLNVSMLNEEVMKDIIGIEDISKSERIAYVEATKGIAGIQKKMTKQGNQGAAFTLYPISFSAFKAVTDNEELMPPKSTFFVPRLFNGFLTYLYE